MANKKLLTMQDLSCVGQCSLTVALPILSAYGVETCVLPTAILSNHTMFSGWSYLDLTNEIENIFKFWQENGFLFDAFLLGYLGKTQLTDVALRCFDRFSGENAKIIVDPVCGDNGKLYPNFDLNYVDAMRKLIRCADVILPNVTEACFLTGTPFRANCDEAFLKKLAEDLGHLTNGEVVVTGATVDGGIAEFVGGKMLLHEKLPQNKHGTGDIFASVFTAHYLSEKDICTSCDLAAAFVRDCIRQTDGDHFYGVNFERILMRKA